ncbi:Protein T25B9.3, isoform a [Aphelenchoides fujianensis]|nr:Protein T25B9.3, isoform a [Aphelenchoides fujianensis]
MGLIARGSPIVMPVRLPSAFLRWSAFLLLLLWRCAESSTVARFEVASVDARSVVVRMLGAADVSHIELTVQIFDLDRLREFRRSSLSTSRHQDQVKPPHFSSSASTGSPAATWFAIRIDYQLLFRGAEGFRDFKTKQELIVRTQDEDAGESNRSDAPHSGLGHQSADGLIQLEGIVTDPNHINVSIQSTFPIRPKVTALIVSELHCEHAIVKPPAQRLHDHRLHIHFDLKQLRAKQRNPHHPPNCSRLCLYPFIRAPIPGFNVQSFRGREWCGTLEEVYEIVGNSMSLAATGGSRANGGISNSLYAFLSTCFFLFAFRLI